jgi:hypothetical protein
VVIASFAALFTAGPGRSLFYNPGPTATVNYGATAFTARKTVIATLYPYYALMPGNGCDQGDAGWSSLWYNGQGKSTCAGDHTHVVATRSTSDTSSAGIAYVISWSNPPGNASDGTLQNFSADVVIGNVSAMAAAYFEVGNPDTVEYVFKVNGDGFYSVARLQASATSAITAGDIGPQFASGNLNALSTHKVAFTVRGTNVTAFLDDVSIGTKQEPSPLATDDVSFWVGNFNHPNSDAPSADFSNFNLSLLA